LRRRIGSDAFMDRGFPRDDEDKVTEHLQAKRARTARFLVYLYLLAADKLLDSVTANLIIDVLTGYLDDTELLFAITPHVYASTTPGSRLRMLVRDFFIHEMCGLWAEDAQARGLPYNFLQDFAVEICRLQNSNYKKTVEDVFEDYPEIREDGHYHLKVDQN
jgi:hypothetical protein